MLIRMFLAATLLLISCGGNDSAPAPERRFKLAFVAAAVTSGDQTPLVRTASVSQSVAASAVDPEDAASQLFDLAEKLLPAYFPGPQANLRVQGFLVRHYPQTGVVLGVANGQVYVLGGPFGEQLRALGAVTDFVTPVVLRMRATVGADGGNLEITDPASPLAGLALQVPAQAFGAATDVAVGVADNPPPLDADLTRLSPTVSVVTAQPARAGSLRLTLPYADTGVTATDAVFVAGYDPAQQRWVMAPTVVGIASGRRITVVAQRLTAFAVVKLAADTQPANSGFRPSLNGSRVVNGVGSAAAGQAGGMLAFAWWYRAQHGACTALAGFNNTTVQANIASQSQARVRSVSLPPQGTRLPWSHFVRYAKRELRAGRPVFLLQVDLRTTLPDRNGLITSEPRFSAMLAYEVNAAGDTLLVYDPNRGPVDGRTLTAATYNDPNYSTYMLAPADFYDDSAIAAVFDGVKTALGCVAPTVSLNANPATVNTGQSVTLSWSAQAARSCTASGDWSGSKSATGGSETLAVGSSAGTRNYTLTCVGAEGTAAASAGVTVNQAPPEACANINGTWTEEATVRLECVPEDESDTYTESGRGSISQQGCNVSYTVAGVQRRGTVVGRTVTLTGPAGIAQPGVTLTVNTFTFTGTISADGRRIDATGVGQISGSYAGGSVSCRLNSTSVLRR